MLTRGAAPALASVLPRLCTHLDRDQGLEITISIKEEKKKNYSNDVSDFFNGLESTLNQ
jgi:hypothetical protein